jgi:hypothetical protein
MAFVEREVTVNGKGNGVYQKWEECTFQEF